VLHKEDDKLKSKAKTEQADGTGLLHYAYDIEAKEVSSADKLAEDKVKLLAMEAKLKPLGSERIAAEEEVSNRVTKLKSEEADEAKSLLKDKEKLTPLGAQLKPKPTPSLVDEMKSSNDKSTQVAIEKTAKSTSEVAEEKVPLATSPAVGSNEHSAKMVLGVRVEP
jgi:hypothetical protein